MLFSEQEIRCVWKVFRQFIYFGLTIGLILILHILAKYHYGMTFQEFGPVKNIQLGLLFISVGGFLLNARLLKKEAPLFLFLASLCLFGICRELDSFFDARLPIISWKFGFLFPCAGLINLYRRRRDIRHTFFYFLETPAFNMMFTAILIGVALAQALGHRPLIAVVLGEEGHARAVRRIFEEGSEVVAYFLIFLSSIECYFNFRSRK